MFEIATPYADFDGEEAARPHQTDDHRFFMPEKKPSARAIIYFDPRPLTREPMSRWLATKLAEFRVIATSDCNAVARLGQDHRDVALVLINVGSLTINHPDITRRLAKFSGDMPDVPMAVITDVDDHAAVVAALGQGLRGFIPTTMAGTVVLEVVRLICAGGTFAPATSIIAGMLTPAEPTVAETQPRIVPPSSPDGFTPRQMEILNCLRRGLANKLIAHELNMRESTVKVHVRNIMKKLRATNRTQVVSMTWQLLDNLPSDKPAATPSMGIKRFVPTAGLAAA